MQSAMGSVARWGLILLAAGLLVPVPAVAQQQPATEQEAAAPSEQQRNAATLKLLQEPVQLEFIDTPLNDVVAFMADHSKLQFYIDRKALGDAGIPLDVPLLVELENISREMALDLTLRQADLTYYVRDGVIIITTPSALEQIAETIVYPAADLLNPGKTREDLVDLITSTVTPESWDHNGGLGVVRAFRGALVVTHNPNVHRKIERLLNELRLHAVRAAEAAATEASGQSAGDSR